MMQDPFAILEISAEMDKLIGVRYVCLGDNCDWIGYTLMNGVCPCCCGHVVDRWEAHAVRIGSQNSA